MRHKIYLNGEWNFMPDYQNQAPDEAVKNCQWETRPIRVPSSWRWILDPEADYQPYDMFGYPREWNEAQSGVINRTFTVEQKDNERVFLVFEGVLQKSAIFVNGDKVFETEEGFLPLEIDITAHINNGQENDLKVWCGPFSNIDYITGQKDLAPNGSWFGKLARGIWQDVYLEYRPALFIDDVFVQTSTRRQEIKVDVSGHNLAATQKGMVKLTVYDGDTIVKELTSDKLSLSNGDTFSLSLRDSWSDAICWSPENPHLYTLKTEFVSNNQTIDSVDTRFGFREVWLEGYKLYLNGTRLNLRMDAWHYQGFVQQTKQYALNWYQVCKETGINCVRPHAMPYPEFYLEAADEVGMLIVDESAIYGSAKSNPADHPQFIKNCHQHLRALVKRDRNHPSIIMWSMQNEMRWVDGRDGYKAAMISLTQAIKDLDGTRPVSYDGDNRLVDPENMEIVSMHYNIDGTVQSWQKDKPLIFGEHGKWHYVCPQACVDLGGPEAFYSYDHCQKAIGIHERFFIEHARKEDVTGICPFNLSNYMVRTMPPQDITLTWDDPSAPGVKPDVIKANTMTINNGHYEGPLFRPDPSWQPVREAFKPVTVIADEYNTTFFGGTELTRSFSIYNDTEQPVEAKLVYQLTAADGSQIAAGEEAFTHAPAEREKRRYTFVLPDGPVKQDLTLQIDLYHGDTLVHAWQQVYQIYPRPLPSLDTNGKKVGFVGNEKNAPIISGLLPAVTPIQSPDDDTMDTIALLIIGRNFAGKLAEWQPVLKKFVTRGGFLLILEQNSFMPGEITLSGKKFYSTYINDSEHPVFKGLTDDDLRFWGPDNIHENDQSFLVQNAFHKPVQGDLKILLECGGGDFGYGGMLWTPLLEYAIGQGRVVLNQVELMANFETAPQAAQLLRNLLAYGLEYQPTAKQKVGLIAAPDAESKTFFDTIGLVYNPVSDNFADAALIILDPNELDEALSAKLKIYVENGGSLLVLPLEPKYQKSIQTLLGEDVAIKAAELYQVKPNPHLLNRGISPHDLFHIERASYALITQENTIVCENAIATAGGQQLWESLQNPWVDYFIKHHDEEFRKVAVATMIGESEFKAQCYGLVKNIGQGNILFSQVRLLNDNEKIKRIYARLLSNLEAEIQTQLLSYVKDQKDYGIESVMALPHLEHQDYAQMEAYFIDPNFILNNLGEGVYGWMKPLHKENGQITVPNSARQTYFLTVFVESVLNRDLSKRVTGVLPDPSIVPDMDVSINCSFKLFINGHCHFDYQNPQNDLVDLHLEDTVLSQGINRVVLVCRAASEENIKLNACFKNKFGDYLTDLKYHLTQD